MKDRIIAKVSWLVVMCLISGLVLSACEREDSKKPEHPTEEHPQKT